MNALSDVVSDQYSKWVYPEPIQDLPGWLANNWQWFDPSHAHRILWPDRDYRADLEILVAGCGTNQAAVIAFTNPGARVLGVDVSQASLDHQQFLKNKYGLKNLDLCRIPIEDIASLNRRFDLIISTGVLHHLASPEAGLTALAGCLHDHGVIGLMLYAKHGRIGVEMLQSVFREMALGQSEGSIKIVRDAISLLPNDHPVQSYLRLAPDLSFDAGLVDTFLHGRDRSYSIDACRALVVSSGLAFQDLFFKAPYSPPHSASGPFYSALKLLPKEQQWSVMERINFRNGCHFFLACHPDRCPDSYNIDFSSQQALRYIPSFRYRCRLNVGFVQRPDWQMGLSSEQQMILELVDGRRSIQEIAGQLLRKLKSKGSDGSGLEGFEIQVKEQLALFWRLDFLAMGLPPKGG